jgi:hypothetical protein
MNKLISRHSSHRRETVCVRGYPHASRLFSARIGVPSSVWGDFLQEDRLVEAVRHPSSCVATFESLDKQAQGVGVGAKPLAFAMGSGDLDRIIARKASVK